jgi:hypothetical protein
MTEDHIFPTCKPATTNVFPIDLGYKATPLRSFSTNLAVRQSQVEYDNNHVVSNVDFVYYNGTTDKSKTANKNEQIKSSFFGNRIKIIIFSSFLFVVAFVVIIAVIMIVLATASK